jgi:hypothetical protein
MLRARSVVTGVVMLAVAGGTAYAAAPKPDRPYSGSLSDYLNNGTQWTKAAKRKASFMISADGKQVLNFSGAFYYYCGASNGAITAAAVTIDPHGRFRATSSAVARSGGTVTGTNYYMLAGHFIRHGKAAVVSYLDDFVYAGKTVAHPYGTAYHPSTVACESWVHGTIAVH